MGQGQDKIARALIDLQPTAIVEMFLLYFNTVDQPTSYLAFHGGAIFNQGITWQGVEYLPVPVETEGFEVNANGQLARPKIRVSNKDYFITDLLLRNNDLQFAKLIRKRTFVKFLDNKNFDGGNPWGQADSSAEISNDTFVISQKLVENKNYVEFELSSPLDLENFELNKRMVLARYCSWNYRGDGCNYIGPPIETEEGQSLNINAEKISSWYSAPFDISRLWRTGISYSVGDAVYLENNKVLMYPDPTNLNIKQPARIWYVCQSGHSSANSNMPEGYNTYWSKDGCSKKLGACKKRFQNTSMQSINTGYFQITNNYVNFTSKLPNPTNNITKDADITATSEFDKNWLAVNIGNGLINETAGSAWATTTADTRKEITLSWPSTQVITKINLYDRNSTSINFNNAKLTFSDSTTGLITSIPTNGSIISYTPSSPKSTTSLKISGSGYAGTAGLTEVEVLTSGLGLYNTSFKSDGVHLKDFSIAMWAQFSYGVPKTGKYNLFNFSKNDSSYGGVNVYIDSANKKVVCEFGLLSVSGVAATKTPKVKSISGDYGAIFNASQFAIVLGVRQAATGVDSSIYLSDLKGKEICAYILSGQNTTKNYSGEVFKFMDSAYQSSVGDLFLGVNNWQYTGSKVEYISPMKIGNTVIWKSRIAPDSDVHSFFTRRNAYEAYGLDNTTVQFPRVFSEIPTSAKGNYIRNAMPYAWWDMDLVPNGGNYKVLSSTGTADLILSGVYNSLYETTYTTGISASLTIQQTKIPKYLPFGGFPGTDKYGS